MTIADAAIAELEAFMAAARPIPLTNAVRVELEPLLARLGAVASADPRRAALARAIAARAREAPRGAFTHQVRLDMDLRAALAGLIDGSVEDLTVSQRRSPSGLRALFGVRRGERRVE